jgi:hypothetical protein
MITLDVFLRSRTCFLIKSLCPEIQAAKLVGDVAVGVGVPFFSAGLQVAVTFLDVHAPAHTFIDPAQTAVAVWVKPYIDAFAGEVKAYVELGFRFSTTLYKCESAALHAPLVSSATNFSCCHLCCGLVVQGVVCARGCRTRACATSPSPSWPCAHRYFPTLFPLPHVSPEVPGGT